MRFANQYRHMPGLGEAAVTPLPAATYEEYCEYVFNKDLAANTEYLDLGINVDGDSDFLWQAVKGSQTGAYEILFRLPNNRPISSARVRNANAIGTAQFPVPIGEQGIRLNAGSKLSIDIKDLSAAPNTVQIVLVGKRLLRA